MMDEQALKVESLAERLARAANDNAPPPQNSRLNFLKKLIPGRRRLADRLTPPLPSGLLIEEVEELGQAISTALRQLHRKGQTLQAEVRPTDVTLRELGPVWEATFGPTVVQDGRADPNREQPTLARLFYALLVGSAARLNNADDLQALRSTFPETVRVLTQALHGEYSSSGEMAGAFGWSLYRREQVLHAPPEPRQPKIAPKPVVRPVEIEEETAPRPTPGNLTGLTAWASLGLAMILLVVFIIYSVVTASQPAPSQQASITPTVTLAPTIAPTNPPALQTNRQNDGSYQTRYQAAWADPTQSVKWVAPSDLAPGNVTSLTTGRPMQVADVGFPPGQTLYLSLADGGWEVWDSVSKSRISRRELPNADQYWRVSYSPDGENFAAITFDGQLRLGTEGRVLRTINYLGNVSNYNGGFIWQLIGNKPFLWSPNSNYVLITSLSGMQLWSFQNGVHQVESPDKSNSSPFSQGDYLGVQNNSSFVWSGNSRYLAAFNGREAKIYVYDPQNLTLVSQISTAQPNQPIYTTNSGEGQGYLAWSPDGSQMALLRWVLNNNGNYYNSTQAELAIWKTPPLSSSDTLTPTNVQIIKLKDILSSTWPVSAWLDWSNNSRLLLGYRRADTAPSAEDSWRLQVYNTDYANNTLQPGQSLNLPVGSTPILIHWLPDSERILYNDRTGRLLYYVAHPDQSQLSEGPVLNQGQQRANWITGWANAPDGKTIATIYNNSRLEITDAQTGQIIYKLDYPDQILNNGGYGAALKWSSDGHYLALGYILNNPTGYTNGITTNGNNSGGRINEPIIRVWQLDSNQPRLVGDYLLPNDNSEMQFDWDTTSPTPAIFFQIGVNRIGEWDLTRPIPSLADQRKFNWIISNGGREDAPEPPAGALPFKVVGQVGLQVRTSGRGNGVETLWPKDWRTFAVGQAAGSGDVFSIFKVYTDTTKPATGAVKLDPNPVAGDQSLNGLQAQAISPDGRLVAFGLNNGLVNVYETSGGKLVQSWQAHQGLITLVRWSPDGKHLATGATDRTVKVWDAASWRLTDVLRGSYDQPGRLEWLPDNKTLFVSTGTDTVTASLWKIKS